VPHNKRLLKLLYRTAEWHGFAKLRVHTQSTLDRLEWLTNELGCLMRGFRNLTCSKFETKALDREVEVQMRAQKRRAQSAKSSGVSASKSAQRKKILNLFTPKFHALGDYVHNIRMFGTTDSYSTQLVWISCCHCTPIYSYKCVG